MSRRFARPCDSLRLAQRDRVDAGARDVKSRFGVVARGLGGADPRDVPTGGRPGPDPRPARARPDEGRVRQVLVGDRGRRAQGRPSVPRRRAPRGTIVRARTTRRVGRLCRCGRRGDGPSSCGRRSRASTLQRPRSAATTPACRGRRRGWPSRRVEDEVVELSAATARCAHPWSCSSCLVGRSSVLAAAAWSR